MQMNTDGGAEWLRNEAPAGSQQHTPVKGFAKLRVVTALAVLAGSLAVGTAGASPAQAWTRFRAATDGVALRSGPATTFTLLQRVNRNTPLDVACATVGADVGPGNQVWLKLTGGQWVSDYFTDSDGWGTRYPSHVTGCSSVPEQGRTRGVTERSNSGVPGQCTWGAKEMFRAATGVYPAVFGNARDYPGSASSQGWRVTTQPHPRAMVVFQPGVYGANSQYGHVAFVRWIEHRSDGVYIAIREMNRFQPGVWTERTIRHIQGLTYILAV